MAVEAIDTCNGHLCMAAGNHGFVVLDLAQPSNPTILGHQPQFWPSGIISEGQYAYLVDDLEGLRVFDISNPSQPQQVGLMPTSVGGFEFAVHEMKERGLYLADGKLYIPDQRYGLTVVDVSNPSSPARIGQYVSPIPDVLTGIKVIDDLAYIISRSGGFRVLDVSDPENMMELSFDDARKNLNTQVPSGIEVIGNFAYISDQNYPFHVYDISTPSSPAQVSAVYDHAASSGADDLVISGNYAYLSGWGLQDAFYPGTGIWVIDISNPRETKLVGFVDLPNESWSLSIQGQTLYALDGVSDRKEPEPFALRILDISRPEQPVLVNSIVIPEFQPLSRSDVISSGERLYVGIGFAGLKLFDISDLLNPVEVLMPIDPSLTSYAFRLAIEGSTLLINAAMALDIKDRDVPSLLGIAMETIEPWTCDMEGDRVYIGTVFHGLYVYELDRGN